MTNTSKNPLARLFIAVELDEGVRERLGDVRKQFRDGAWRIAWVQPTHMHLTLVFLGDTLCETIPMVQRVVDDVAADDAPMALSLQGIGWFGRSRHPRVVWARVDEASGRLAIIQKALDTKLREIGFFWPEQEFVQHVTLGRVKLDHSGGELARLLDEVPTELYGESPATGLSLIQSTLTPTGPRYDVLHTAPFRAA